MAIATRDASEHIKLCWPYKASQKWKRQLKARRLRLFQQANCQEGVDKSQNVCGKRSQAFQDQRLNSKILT